MGFRCLAMVITHNELLQKCRSVLLFVPAEFFMTNICQPVYELRPFLRTHNPISKCSHSFVAEYFRHGLFFFPLVIIGISLENDLFVVSKDRVLNQIAAEFCDELESMQFL